MRALEGDGFSSAQAPSVLRMHPSRLVGLFDELEKRALIERRNREQDRRVYALYLTKAGESVFDQIRNLAAKHQELICSALSEAECRRLADLLQRIADARELTLGVHPGVPVVGSASQAWGLSARTAHRGAEVSPWSTVARVVLTLVANAEHRARRLTRHTRPL